ncbi:lytic transglycosylase domain-containing protein [Streptacidiphilus sp. ASG 303]|uniref:aggregation-promoting factor C-terminal-like domain-containing protein n=1 Tax=Streptacidiphilus sp. ASG 303 TaxID=2896847 RepID=UPI001E4DC8C1|nr:transglycosylase SLT domain-containing protein [Streptacidiphilus sp. ASG 303]MCD0483725.1 lytic transglycosylase domain-containing protein [Streptacidiphilus sp. ASG 303]
MDILRTLTRRAALAVSAAAALLVAAMVASASPAHASEAAPRAAVPVSATHPPHTAHLAHASHHAHLAALSHDRARPRVPRADRHGRSAAPASPRLTALRIVGGGSRFLCFSAIVERESGWDPTAVNPSSGAYGLVQALPGSKMASAGGDWRTDPATQIRWGLSYMNGRYGSPCGAWAFWRTHHWY